MNPISFRPSRRRITGAALRVLALALVVVLCPSNASADFNYYAEATGSVWDPDAQKLLTFHELNLPVASGAVTSANGGAGAVAGVGLTYFPNPNPLDPGLLVHIDLRAFARSIRGPDADPEVGPPVSTATARFHDDLVVTIEDEVYLAPFYLELRPRVTGTITGGASVSFNASLGGDGQALSGAGELVIRRVHGADFGDLTMDLTLTAFSGGPGESVADFSHTATIGQFFITDADGNPLPNPPHLTIVGRDSGLTYDVAVPEPSAACLALIVGCTALARRRRRVRRAGLFPLQPSNRRPARRPE